MGMAQNGMSASSRQINYQTNLRVRFAQPQPTAVVSNTVTRLQTRLNASERIRKLGDITVSMRNQTARLAGTVSSERDRQLALGLALLEPGISSVEDGLVVAEQAEPIATPPVEPST
jgi:osmotically-inducible protein OsmY